MAEELYDFQKKCVDDLLAGKHFVILPTGRGKTAIAMRWAKATGKSNMLVVTTPRKRNSGDMLREADKWNGDGWRQSLSCYSVIAYTGLKQFVDSHYNLSDWAIIFDEIRGVARGIQSQRGKAFLKLAKRTECWSGYTATPGDRWIDFYAYAVATGLVRNLTDFRSRFCNLQTFKGYPEIISYRNTDKLEEWWDKVSTRPDTSEMDKEMPAVIHKTIELPIPRGYKELDKTHMLDGEFIETAGGMNHARRRLVCLDEARQEWLAEFIECNPEPVVIFTCYTAERDMIEEIYKKIRPEGRCWRIDGKHHDNPTKDNVKRGDIIVVDYQAGSEALELQFCHYCIFYSLTYTYWQAQQARGRVYRKGQTQTTYYYYLVVPGTIDDGILKALKHKKDFAHKVWEPEGYML